MVTEAQSTNPPKPSASAEGCLTSSGTSGTGGNLPADVLDYLITCSDEMVADANALGPPSDKQDGNTMGSNIAGALDGLATNDQVEPCVSTKDETETNEKETTSVPCPPSSQQRIQGPSPPNLRRVTDLNDGRAQPRVGAYRVQPEAGVGQRIREGSFSSDGCSEDLESEGFDAFTTVAIAELVDEDERDAARDEINRLRRELEELQQERRTAEVVVAEPISPQQQTRSSTYYYGASGEMPPTPLCPEFMHYHDLKDTNKQLADASNMKLSFDADDHLLGRETQLQQLQDAFQGVVPTTDEPSKMQLVLIGGLSGTGKSAFARQTEALLLQHAKTKEGIYMTGKFDERESSMPYSAVSEACEKLCQALLQRTHRVDSEDANPLQDLPMRIREVLDPEDTCLLVAIMPSLNEIVGGYGATLSSSINYLEAMHRFQHAFRRFMRLISSLVPLVLVLEDLQWVDQASLDLIEFLVTDDESKASMILVLTYRDNEVDENHLFTKSINNLKEQQAGERHVNITEINVGGLNEEDVCRLLQLHLGYELEEAQLFAECVHSKTGGNPFYVKQFLLSLQANQLLTFNPELQRWDCNVTEIWTAARATDNVGALLSEKLQKLPSMIRAILPRVACLGSRFATATAQIILKDSLALDGAESTDSVEGILQTCQHDGLLIYCGQGTWSWEHDSVKEAALLLASDGEALDAMKYEIGELLLGKLPAEELASSHETFATANLLNLRASLLADENPRRIEIANLNLRAGKASLRASAFKAAAQYFKQGIGLLPAENTKWATHFDLSLELYAGAAEAHFCIGDHPQVKELCEEVLALTSCPLLKKRRAYNVMVHSLSSQGQMVRAQALLMKGLGNLGYKFPKFGRSIKATSGMMKLVMTANKTASKLDRLKPMEDEEKKWALYLLDRMFDYTYQCERNLCPLAILKSLDVTVKYGLTDMTSPIMAGIALILAGSFGDFAGAKKFADLAIKYMTSSSVSSRTLFICYQFVMHYQMPTHFCIQQLSIGADAGLKSGDYESAFWASYCVLEAQLHTGWDIARLLEDCETFSRRTASYNQEMIGWSVQPVWQLASNLAGKDSNKHVLTGSVMDEDEFRKRTEPYAHYGVQLNRLKVSAAFWFDEHELVVELMEANGYDKFSIEKATPATNGIGTLYFHCAMSCLSLVHKGKPKHRPQKRQAKKLLKKLKDWANKGNPNVQHYESLLEAELASMSRGKPFIVAAKHYDCAIMVAGRLGLANDCGLAQERFGDHFLRHGDSEGAKIQYRAAMECYGKWGAQTKVEVLRTKLC